MLYLDDRSIYRVTEFEQFPWLIHGFGTAHSIDWPPEPMASVSQIHSACVLRVEDSCSGRLGQADAIICNRPGCSVGVRTADCVPLLLVDPDHQAVAAVHAGWRGTVADIATATISAMAVNFGTKSRHLWAAIGPAIGGCCFEVGPEVAIQFNELFPERDDLRQKTNVDLIEGNFRRLVRAGVSPERIVRHPACTYCTPGGLLHSGAGNPATDG